MNTLQINQTSSILAPSIFSKIFHGLAQAFARIPNPVQALRAYEQLSKFRKLDSKALQDVAISPLNVKEMTVVDFFYSPSSNK